jgi:phosphoribosylaminoimidazole-succinocarboxamide synthase
VKIFYRKELFRKKIPCLENTRDLFQRGTEIAASRGLILVDTKYEFGKTKEGVIVLIDEIHTPDSSRYFTKDTRNVKTAVKNKTIIERVCSSLVNRKWFSRFGRATNS